MQSPENIIPEIQQAEKLLKEDPILVDIAKCLIKNREVLQRLQLAIVIQPILDLHPSNNCDVVALCLEYGEEFDEILNPRMVSIVFSYILPHKDGDPCYAVNIEGKGTDHPKNPDPNVIYGKPVAEVQALIEIFDTHIRTLLIKEIPGLEIGNFGGTVELSTSNHISHCAYIKCPNEKERKERPSILPPRPHREMRKGWGRELSDPLWEDD